MNHLNRNTGENELVFKLGAKVAIKIFIHPKLSSSTNDNEVQLAEYEASMSHFFNEENFLTKLDHPNIVKVYESRKSVEVNIPSYINQDGKSQKEINLQLKQNLENQEFVKNLDKNQ